MIDWLKRLDGLAVVATLAALMAVAIAVWAAWPMPGQPWCGS